ENEIVVCDGKVFERGLCAVPEALPRQTAGADSHPRLNRLVAGPLRVARRIQERLDALPLIVLQRELVGEKSQRQARERDDAEQPHPEARKIRHTEKDRQQRDGGAEVWLPGDEDQRNAGENARDDQVTRVSRAAPVFTEKPREEQRDGQ